MGNEVTTVLAEQGNVATPRVKSNFTGIDKEYARLYDEHDVNRDGVLSLAELQKLVARCGIFLSDERKRKEFFFDANLRPPRNGKLDIPAFLELMHQNKQLREIEQTFAVLDLDGDGIITVDEIQQSMERLGQRIDLKQAAAFLRHFDQNRDNKISFEEFAKMMNANRLLVRRMLSRSSTSSEGLRASPSDDQLLHRKVERRRRTLSPV